MICADSSMNTRRLRDGSAKADDSSVKQIELSWFFSEIYLDLKYRQKQNGGYELKKVFAEKYYA
jgi:hypothetical protein